MGELVLDIRYDKSPRLALFQMAAKRLWPLVVLLGLAGAGLGYLAGGVAPLSQRAHAVILVSPLEGNPFYPSQRGELLINLTTEAQVLASDAVAKLVVEETGTKDTPTQVLTGLRTSVPPNTQLIEINYEHDDPAIAQQRAQSFAEKYLEFRSTQAAKTLDGQISGIQGEIEKLNKTVGQLRAALEGNPSQAEAAVLQAQLDANAQQIASLGARESTLATTRIDPGQVVTQAATERPSIIGVRGALVLAGLLFGLLLAALIIMVASSGRGRVRRTAELSQHSLDALALAAAGQGSVKNRARLQSLVDHPGHAALLVAPAERGRRSNTAALLVCQSLAGAGLRTLFIDASGTPSGEEPGHPTLVQVLQHGGSLRAAAGPAIERPAVLQAGDLEGYTAESGSVEALRSALNDTLGSYDAVVIAAGELHQLAAQWLAAAVPTVLLEVVLGSTRHRDVSAAMEAAMEVGAEVELALTTSPGTTAPSGDYAMVR